MCDRGALSRAGGGRKGGITKAVLVKTLKALTPAQVVDLVVTICDKHPDVKSDIVGMLPSADVDSMIKALQTARRKISGAFPHVRWGSNADNYAFKRVSPTLSAFKAVVARQAQPLCTGKMWGDLLAWATKAYPIISSLPKWDSASNNEGYEPMFKRLKTFLQTCLDSGALSAEQKATATTLLANYSLGQVGNWDAVIEDQLAADDGDEQPDINPDTAGDDVVDEKPTPDTAVDAKPGPDAEAVVA